MATTEPGDRTGRAMAAQLRAMGIQQVEVGLLHGPTNRMSSRVWTPDEAQAALNWLRRENMRGCNVYVRPVAWQGSTPASAGIVLVDDLTREGVAQLHRDGLGPAAVTETSPRTTRRGCVSRPPRWPPRWPRRRRRNWPPATVAIRPVQTGDITGAWLV